MKREEAIDILNDERIVIWTEPDEEEIARKQNEAIDMAIEALSVEPTDLISRAGVSAWLSNMGHDKLASVVIDTRRFPSADVPTKCIAKINIDTDEIVKRIKNEYEIVDKPIGEWIPRPYEIDYKNDAACSICGEIVIDGNGYNYCPNCGIKMKSKKEEK